jgi:single-strand DNA-binding protein
MMGRIANDLEIKTTQSGTSVLTFRLAVDRSYKDADGNRDTDFFNFVAWRSNADFIAKFFDKGRLILLDAEAQNRTYTDKNGTERLVTEFLVNRVTLLVRRQTTQIRGILRRLRRLWQALLLLHLQIQAILTSMLPKMTIRSDGDNLWTDLKAVIYAYTGKYSVGGGIPMRLRFEYFCICCSQQIMSLRRGEIKRLSEDKWLQVSLICAKI